MKTFAVTGTDGSVVITTPVGDAKIEDIVALMNFPGFTPASWKEIDPASIPADREYRDAWSYNGKRFGHDMTKAREVHKEKLRTKRTELFAELDLEVSKATAKGDAARAAKLEERRQKLRDVTKDPRIAAAASIEDLRKVEVES
jgi:hypothetical protein